MRLLISGASGFLGTALTARLTGEGHQVVRLVRRPATGADEHRWDPYGDGLDPAALAGVDAVVNLSGAGVGDRRWNSRYKDVLGTSRVETTAALARAIAAAPAKPSVLLNSSAIGFYGDTGDRTVTESDPAGEGFLADLCRAWESATRPMDDSGVRVAYLRTGLVLAASEGLLKKMLPLFRAGLGGRLGSGRQYLPWITLEDWLRAALFLLTADVTGPVNLVGPNPVSNAEFTRALGAEVRRPAVLPVPAFALRIALGEFAQDTVSGQRALPEALLRAGFRFEHPDLAEALHWSLEN